MLANICLHTLCSDHYQLMCIKLIPVSERSEILEKDPPITRQSAFY